MSRAICTGSQNCDVLGFRMSVFGNMSAKAASTHKHGRIKETSMSTSQQTTNDESPEFTFGVRELRDAEEKQRPQSSARQPAPRSHARSKPATSGRESYGTDPYNTSGSFDRSRNWMRVGKR